MIIAISGASGFIGRSLVQKLRETEHSVRVINRDSLALSHEDFTGQKIDGADVVINLAGAPVSKKWTAAGKKEIMESRIHTTRRIVDSIRAARQKPSLFISASAIGIYDSVHQHTENSGQYATGFLAEVCRRWEEEALPAAGETRLVILRIGMVLGAEGGALKKMKLPFSFGLGGKIGTGQQAVSFIHIYDLIEAICFIIDHPEMSGIVNAVSPYPSTNSEFTEKLAKVLGQPAWFTVPAFVLRMVMGEGSQIVLEGQTVFPGKLSDAGFRFRYPTIQNALVRIYG